MQKIENRIKKGRSFGRTMKTCCLYKNNELSFLLNKFFQIGIFLADMAILLSTGQMCSVKVSSQILSKFYAVYKVQIPSGYS